MRPKDKAMNRVLIRKSSYDYSVLRPVIFEIMDKLGGKEIGKNAKVLLKPNFLAPAKPEEAILTHPLIIKAVAEYVLERGAKPKIADSPAVGSFSSILKQNGVSEALKEMPVDCKPFHISVRRDIGPPFGKIEIARDVFDADFIINLPKLKTHESMMLTLGVKNLFGCIIGLRKPDWHFRTGVDRDYFAHLLVLIHNTVNPYMSILDGILALEGEGPGRGGTPRELGYILGSKNAFALDLAVCNMVGLDSNQLYTCKAAARMGFIQDEPEIDGEMPLFNNFKMPKIIPLVFGPKPLQGFIRKHFIRKPAVKKSICRLCEKCCNFCPTHAIERIKDGLIFKYENCIRCFCCLEICPEGALKSKNSFGEKLIHAYLKIRRSQSGIPE